MLTPNEIGDIALKYLEKNDIAADFSVCGDGYCQINFKIGENEDWIKLRRFTSTLSVVRTIKSTLKTKGAN